MIKVFLDKRGSCPNGRGGWKRYAKTVEKEVDCAVDITEAKELHEVGNSSILYLGKLCPEKHRAKTLSGRIDKSVRFFPNNGCRDCHTAFMRRKLKAEKVTPTSGRFSQEDYISAKELGLTLEEYKDMIGKI